MANKKEPTDEAATIARYLIVSQVCAAIAAGKGKTAAIKEVAERVHLDKNHRPHSAGERSLWRWLGQWEAEGLEGLASARYPSRESSLPPAFLSLLKEKKEEDPKISVPEVIRIARVSGVIAEDEAIDRTTVWRHCKREGLPTLRRDPSKRERQRPWRFAHRMQCVIADGKHFRAGSKRAKRVAIIYFDNASRYMLGAVVGTVESAALALRGLRKVIRRWGLMTSLYVDLGFDNDDLARATAALRIALILGTKQYPEARGCLERFNRTIAEQLLCGWPGNPTIDPELLALKRRIEHWGFELYNHTDHEGLEHDKPSDRFHGDTRALEIPYSQTIIDEAFVTSFERRVTNHNCVSFKGVLWEMPLGYRRNKVKVFRNMISGELSVLHKGNRTTLKPANQTRNANERSTAPAPDQQDPPARTTAADIAWDRDHPPLVDDKGNYSG
jgi:transposase InsO family protein